MLETLTMLPEVQARRILDENGIAVTERIVRPPYPALGVGVLRVLRLRECEAGPLEMLVGYENYERLD